MVGLEHGPLGQRLDDLPRTPDGAGHVHDGLVADEVGEGVHLPVELHLDPLHVGLLPPLGGHQRGGDVDQDAPGQDTGEGLLDGHLHVLELPAEVVEVPLVK